MESKIYINSIEKSKQTQSLSNIKNNDGKIIFNVENGLEIGGQKNNGYGKFSGQIKNFEIKKFSESISVEDIEKKYLIDKDNEILNEEYEVSENYKNTNFVYLDQEVKNIFSEFSDEILSSAKKYLYHGGNGNLLEEVDYGEVKYNYEKNNFEDVKEDKIIKNINYSAKNLDKYLGKYLEKDNEKNNNNIFSIFFEDGKIINNQNINFSISNGVNFSNGIYGKEGSSVILKNGQNLFIPREDFDGDFSMNF
jgi:hypothetical protein